MSAPERVGLRGEPDAMPALLTPREAAAALGVHVDTLRHWPVPAMRTPGGQRRYDRAVIDAIIAGTWRRP